MNSENISKKTWSDFRSTGLFAFINSILHAFGWVIVIEVDDNGKVITTFPARTKYRGFSEEDQDEYYKNIGQYLADNATELNEEIK